MALQRFYGEVNEPGLQALVLGGAADALRLEGRHEEALAMYRRGIAVAADSMKVQALLNLLSCAGEVCLKLSEYDEAEGYFGLAMEVSARLVNVHTRCDSMENRGIARMAQGEPFGAAKDWVAAKDLSKKYGYVQRFVATIDRLIGVYAQAELRDRVQALRAEKARGATP
jgi:tetratricopeptide (TPR) repeat protein